MMIGDRPISLFTVRNLLTSVIFSGLAVPLVGQAMPLAELGIPTNAPTLLAQYGLPATTYINAVDGTVNVQLINLTGATLDYSVTGQTELRTLAGQSDTTLLDLPLPTSVNFYRQDRGMLDASLQITGDTVVITVQATTDYRLNRSVLDIDDQGSIYLY